MAAEYDHLLKLVLVGDASVGKCSLLVRFTEGSFDMELPSTIGVDFKVRPHGSSSSIGGIRISRLISAMCSSR